MTATTPAKLALSIDEAAALLGVKRSTAYGWLAANGHRELVAGVLAFKVGSRYKVGRGPLEDFIATAGQVAS